jgi:dihydrofolate synthase/folylpolyglutamate synthase
MGVVGERRAASRGYKEALDYLFARTTGGVKFGLERTSALLEHLGNPHRAFRSIHVAGTNGKGSSVATMDALLKAKGLRVARYTSPHLVDFRERMIVGDTPISAEYIVDFVTRHTPLVEEIGATFFEATTAMAFDYFARANVDVALIEAGLGGRLDSTNVLTPLAAGVTSIGFDHTEYLGSSLESIAAEKAGIFKPGVPAVIGEPDPRIRSWLAEHAERAHASRVRIVADETTMRDVTVSDAGTSVILEWLGTRHRLRTPLAGAHQALNLAFSLVLLDAADADLRVDPREAPAALGAVRIPGRFQHTGRYIFDVAHNAAGADVLARTLASVRPPGPLSVLFCALRDKDWRDMLRTLGTAGPYFVLTMAPTAPASRAWSLDEAIAFARGAGLSAEATPDFDVALDRARATGTTVLVTGSFHTVGDAMARLQVSPLAG